MTLPAYSSDMYPGKPHAFEPAGPTFPATLCVCFKHRDHASHVEPRYEHKGNWQPEWYAAGDHEALPHHNDRGSCALCLYPIRKVKS